jgi:hypothetical protein
MALGQRLTQSIGSNDNLTRAAKRKPAALSKDLSRLISAAVVSAPFRNLLLADPVAALAAGYNGEHFHLTPTEHAIVTSLRASNIREFAARLLSLWQSVTSDAHVGELQFAEVSAQPLDTARNLPAPLARHQAAHLRGR